MPELCLTFSWASWDELNQLFAKSLRVWRKWTSRDIQICLSLAWLDFILPLAFSLPIATWPTWMLPLQSSCQECIIQPKNSLLHFSNNTIVSLILVINLFFFSDVEKSLNLENRQRNIYVFCPFLRFSNSFISTFPLILNFYSRI